MITDEGMRTACISDLEELKSKTDFDTLETWKPETLAIKKEFDAPKKWYFGEGRR